ncbi:MAG: hypothetical protein HZB62_12645 [Nitrospirae bacterium]|nr:hypothetical protein [Nitrospirota bacterium]
MNSRILFLNFTWACMCLVLFFSVLGCKREALPQKQTNEVVTATTVIATIADHEKPHSSTPAAGHSASQDPTPVFQIEFSKNGAGVAYLAKVGETMHVVHNGRPGKSYKELYDYTLTISPDGQRVAYGAKTNSDWFMVVNDKEYGPFEDVGPPVFSSDGRHIAYEIKQKNKWHIVVDNDKRSAACSSYFEKPVFNDEATRIAFVENPYGNKKMRLVISDLEFRKQVIKEYDFLFIMAKQVKSKVAAVIQEKNNKKRVIELNLNQPDVVKEGALYDELANLAFGNVDATVTYAATTGGRRVLVLNGKEEPLPEGEPSGPFIIRPDSSGGAVILATREGFYMHPAFAKGEQGKTYEEVIAIEYSRDGSQYVYAARKGKNWFVVISGKEGPSFDNISSQQFSPDGTKVVYRARKGEKRFLVVSDTNGKVIRQHPAYERIFEPVFTADGKSVAYGVKNGNQLIWKVEKLEEK